MPFLWIHQKTEVTGQALGTLGDVLCPCKNGKGSWRQPGLLLNHFSNPGPPLLPRHTLSVSSPPWHWTKKGKWESLRICWMMGSRTPGKKHLPPANYTLYSNSIIVNLEFGSYFHGKEQIEVTKANIQGPLNNLYLILLYHMPSALRAPIWHCCHPNCHPSHTCILKCASPYFTSLIITSEIFPFPGSCWSLWWE